MAEFRSKSGRRSPTIEPLLTAREKDEIRSQSCALCLALPPFADGGRCHVHRIHRGKNGGRYTRSNVVPLCPPCHHAVDGHVTIEAFNRTLSPEERSDHARHASSALTPEQRSSNARNAALALRALHEARGLSEAERRQRADRARKGGSVSSSRINERRRREGLADDELSHCRRIARRGGAAGGRLGGLASAAALTAEQRRERARRASAARWGS